MSNSSDAARIFVVFVTLLGTSFALTATAPSSAFAIPGESGFEWAKGVDIPESLEDDYSRVDIVSLFSGDKDIKPGTAKYRKFVKNYDSKSGALGTYKTHDKTYDYPPRIIQEWNLAMASQYKSFIDSHGGPFNSIFPHNTTKPQRRKFVEPDESKLFKAEFRRDRRVINDAHLSIMTVQPSTVTHVRRDMSGTNKTDDDYDVNRWYIQKNGTVIVAADARVEDVPEPRPKCGVDGSCEPGDKKYVYNHHKTVWKNAELRSTTNLANTVQLDTDNSLDSGMFKFDYSLPSDVTGPQTLIVTAEAQVTLEKEVYVKKKVGTKTVKCDNPPYYSGSRCEAGKTITVPKYDWVLKNTKTLNPRSVSVKDSLSVYRPRGYDSAHSKPTVKIARLPSGKTQVIVKTEGKQGLRDTKWSGIGISTTNPTFETLELGYADESKTTQEINLEEPVGKKTKLHIWARGDFDTFNEKFTVSINGKDVYTGRTGHQDSLYSNKHYVTTVSVPRHFLDKSTLNIKVSPSDSVDSEAVPPKFWFKISHEPRPLDLEKSYDLESVGTETADGQNRERYKVNDNKTVRKPAIVSYWKFFSARDRGWDELWTANRETQNAVLKNYKKSRSPARPVYLHAYPSSRNVSSRVVSINKVYFGGGPSGKGHVLTPTLDRAVLCQKSWDKNWMSNSFDEMLSGGDTKCRFTVDRANQVQVNITTQENYGRAGSVDVKSSLNAYKPATGVRFTTSRPVDKVTVFGLVHNQSTSGTIVEERTVSEVKIKTEVKKTVTLSDNLKKLTVKITLTNSDGEVVNTKKRGLREEYILVKNGKRVHTNPGIAYRSEKLETGADGTVTATVYLPAGEDSFNIQYKSPPWWEVPETIQPYTESETVRDGKIASRGELMRSAYIVGAILLVPLALMYIVAKITGIDLGINAYREVLGEFWSRRMTGILILGLLALYLL